MIPFNKPFLTGKETEYIRLAVQSGKISGNGDYTKKCQDFFVNRFAIKKALLTTSCTDALEMCAILINLQPGDEVIVPSFTFVSTANAFVLRGATIRFADSASDNPNIDANKIEELVTTKTKAIVVVHYAGIACDMDKINAIAKKHNLFVIEDAAQAIESYYKGRPLGSLGQLAAFSFHETKNVISGEGGLLAVNDEQFNRRSEIIWEKGTNRSEFFRGEVNKYGWVDIGSSFLPSEVIAAFLYAQLGNLSLIQQRRKQIWEQYQINLQPLQQNGLATLPNIPDFATNNAHMFYLVLNDGETRNNLIAYLKQNGIMAVFHYLSLHKSDFYMEKHAGRDLPMADYYTDCLVRLPLFYELTDDQVGFISEKVLDFFKKPSS